MEGDTQQLKKTIGYDKNITAWIGLIKVFPQKFCSKTWKKFAREQKIFMLVVVRKWEFYVKSRHDTL